MPEPYIGPRSLKSHSFSKFYGMYFHAVNNDELRNGLTDTPDGWPQLKMPMIPAIMIASTIVVL